MRRLVLITALTFVTGIAAMPAKAAMTEDERAKIAREMEQLDGQINEVREKKKTAKPRISEEERTKIIKELENLDNEVSEVRKKKKQETERLEMKDQGRSNNTDAEQAVNNPHGPESQKARDLPAGDEPTK